MINTLTTTQSKEIAHKKTPVLSNLISKYWAYVDGQEPQKIYWYLKAIIIIPCVYMVISIMAMAQLIEGFEYYIGATMLVFYANVTVHIVDCKSRVYIPLFHLTTAFFIVAPLITYFITK